MDIMQPDLRPLLVEALRGDSHQYFCVIWRSHRERGFGCDGDRTPAIVQFMRLHEAWLIKKLKHSAVTLHWNNGDTHVDVALVGDVEPFPEFKLPFPPSKPYVLP